MRFQITTDYAIRIIIYLAQHHNQVVTAKEMAEQLGITNGYVNKLVRKIKQSGYIDSIQGPVGGYRLAKRASDITLNDIVEAMEGKICINRCLEEDGFCSRHSGHSQICPVNAILAELQSDMIATLKSKRIDEILGKWANSE